MSAEPIDGTTDGAESDKAPSRIARLGTRYQHLRHNHRLGFLLRYLTITAGIVVTAVGIVAIPYPGPGWAIVLLGLLILSQEFEWAARLRRWVMHHLNRLYADYIDGSPLAQAALAVATAAIVMVTLWLTGALALVGGWAGLDWAWLASPFTG